MAIRVEVIVGKSDLKEKMALLKSNLMESAKKAVAETSEIFYNKVYENISMPMHGSTEREHYKTLGKVYHYPFSANKYSKPQFHGESPNWSVHAVSDKMRDTLDWNVGTSDIEARGRIGWITAMAPPEVIWVTEGTSLMLPRRVLSLTAQEINTMQLLVDNFLKYLPYEYKRV